MDIKAWDGIFRDTRFERNIKPRLNGINMVLDKNLGTRALADLLETAGDSIDQIKLAYGTSVALSECVVREKIEMIRAHQIQVFPGGTLLEAAIVQGVLPAFLKRACDLGFSMIEVSDGTIALPQQQRAEVIQRALDLGFQVISEVGKKDPRQQMPVGAMQAQIGADLAHGAKYVIIEAREGGKGVGIYDEDGAVDEVGLDALVTGLEDLERIVWEAPQCPQQAYLINRFGPNVNLGNIQSVEVLALEALRRGFRFETLRHAAAEKSPISKSHVSS
ncbi:MAG: phosphosulfolactate synthase [Chloroflexota bacterium]|nr:phosphosulfolactate synthase [Chloroflexota bacterium]